VTVEAGLPWATLQETLAARGQWLPLDPPALPGATVGGTVAANVSGPKRLQYGTLRDLVIGCRFLLADGSAGRSGGRVVKNVTGYDIHKLLIGSLGTLALITEVSFKILPRPAASGWLAAAFATPEGALAAARDLARSDLSPAALELVDPDALAHLPAGLPAATTVLLVAADGLAVAVRRQLAGLAAICRTQGATTVTPVEDAAATAALWQGLRDLSLADPGWNLRLRWGVLPADLPAAWAAARALAAHLAVAATLHARAGTGLVYLYAALPAAQAAAAATAIGPARAAAEQRGGSLVVETAPPAVKAGVDVWGQGAGAASLPAMQALKQSLDPRQLLNPGRFVGGL